MTLKLSAVCFVRCRSLPLTFLQPEQEHGAAWWTGNGLT